MTSSNYLNQYLILFYFLCLLAYSLHLRKSKLTFENYALANRKLPASMIFASLSATYIGPGYSLALSDKGFESGFLYFFIFSFFALQTIFSAYFLAPKLRFYSVQGCISLGDVVQRFYGQYSKKLVGFVSILLSIGFTAIMAKVGGTVLSGFFGFEPIWGMIVITLVGLAYTATGGLRAVVATEAIQLALILFTFSMLLLICNSQLDKNISVEKIIFDKTIIGFNRSSILTLFGLALAFFFGEMLIPPYANRALSAKNEDASNKGFLWAGLFAFYWFALMLMLGVFASVLIPNKGADTPALFALANYVAIPGIYGLVVASLAAIVMSTQESVLNAGATSFIREFSLNETTKNARIVTIVISVLALLFATISPSVIGILLISYSVWAPAVAVPLVWALLGFKTDAQIGLIAMTFGLISALYANLIIANAADNGLAILIGLAGNTIGLISAWIYKIIGKLNGKSN